MSRRIYDLTTDYRELQRRAQEDLCTACARPLPDDAAYHRQFCDGTCRVRHHRFEKGVTA